MTQLTSPLTPPDCDLRDFPFMPLDVVRLRDSDLAALESPEACWAAVLLWCASWHQVPAASLPDDDRVLANLAGFGRVVKEWQKVREGALRGWVKCSDDRLYHPVVADKANEAWDGRLAYRQRKEADRQRKAEERAKKAAEEQAKKRTGEGNPEDGSNLSGGQRKEIQRTGEGNPEEKPLIGTVERDRDSGEGQGEGQYLKTRAAQDSESSGQQSGESAAPPACEKLAEELRSGGIAITAGHANVIAWVGRGLTIPQAREALAIAKQRKPNGPIPPNYLQGIVDDILNPPAAGKPAGIQETAWWKSEPATLAKGRELGIEPRVGEQMDQYRDRLHTEVKRRKDAV